MRVRRTCWRSLNFGSSPVYVRCTCPALISVAVPAPNPSSISNRLNPNSVRDTAQFRAAHGASTNTNTNRHSPHFARHRFGKETPTYMSNGTSTEANAYRVSVPNPTASALTASAPYTHRADRPAACHFSALNTAYAVTRKSTDISPHDTPDIAASKSGLQNRYMNTLIVATR